MNGQKMPEYLNASFEGDDLFTGDQLRAAVAAEREACAKELEAYSRKHGELTSKNPKDVDYAIMYTLDIHAHLLRVEFFEKHKEKYGARDN